MGTWILKRVFRFVGRPWYPLLVIALAILNAFIPFLPVEIFVIGRALVRPHRWWLWAFSVAAGSAFGGLLLALAVSGHYSAFSTYLLRGLHGHTWERTARIVRRRGAIGIALISVSFIPQQPAIVIGALAHMGLFEITIPILLARSAKYGIYSAIAAYAPQRLFRHRKLPPWFPGVGERDE